MVNTLEFNMSVPTSYVFMRRFLKAAESDKEVGIIVVNPFVSMLFLPRS